MRRKRPRVRAISTSLLLGAFALALATQPALARRRPTPQPTPTAVPTPVATPAPSRAARIAAMHDALAAIARMAPGRLGIAVRDLATGERFAIRGDEAFPIGAIARLATAIVAYRLADQRTFALDDRAIDPRGDDRRRDAGVTATYWQLLRATIVASDEAASDLVLRAVGGPRAVDGMFARLHLTGLDVGASQNDGGSVATPSAVAELFEGLATQRFTLLDSTTELLADLSAVALAPARLRAGLPANVRLAHLPGTSATSGGATEATNDAGIVTLPDGRRIVIVACLAQSHASDAERDATLARVARAVADAYAP